MRCPIYIGIDASTPNPKKILENEVVEIPTPKRILENGAVEIPTPKRILENGAVEMRKSMAGGWELVKNNYEAFIFPLGQATVGLNTYQVFLVIVYKGDQRKVYRFLKNKVDVIGPYTIHNAPRPLVDFLRNLNNGELRTPIVIAGEDISAVDTVDYIEGEAEDGSEDVVI